jgi:hypothetical protein
VRPDLSIFPKKYHTFIFLPRCDASFFSETGATRAAPIDKPQLNARVARDKADEEALIANQNLERLRVEYYDAHKSR